ncbi:MAG: acyltransferase [Lachnospiraceae bacterium]|nr:acyltransferase [Lachnospiraceae bacterium]
MNTFYSEDELKALGLKSYGENVYIGRHVILYSPEKLEIGNNVRIDDFSILSGNIRLGNYIHISHFCGLYGGDKGIVMEDYSGLSSKVTVYGVSDDYSGNSMTNPMIPAEYKPFSTQEKVEIKKHAIVGAGSIILPGVIVGEGSSIGSMSLCIRDTEPWSINVGIPAKKIKERSKELLILEKNFRENRNSEY